MAKGIKPWTPAKATREINRIARSVLFSVAYTDHAKERMQERDLLTGDVLFVLQKGFVYSEAESSTRDGFFKYAIECTTPNSANRKVRLICIAGESDTVLKIVTVMWVDES